MPQSSSERSPFKNSLEKVQNFIDRFTQKRNFHSNTEEAAEVKPFNKLDPLYDKKELSIEEATQVMKQIKRWVLEENDSGSGKKWNGIAGDFDWVTGRLGENSPRITLTPTERNQFINELYELLETVKPKRNNLSILKHEIEGIREKARDKALSILLENSELIDTYITEDDRKKAIELIQEISRLRSVVVEMRNKHIKNMDEKWPQLGTYFNGTSDEKESYLGYTINLENSEQSLKDLIRLQ